ncbi:hypothetical protein EV126DRAFT_412557 [Verticillium dahliae]|nr:hypothetical protein EV126DRAFT_412557 [Verticillium dahliae]
MYSYVQNFLPLYTVLVIFLCRFVYSNQLPHPSLLTGPNGHDWRCLSEETTSSSRCLLEGTKRGPYLSRTEKEGPRNGRSRV